MTLDEANKIISECDAYFGEPGWVPDGVDHNSVIAIDGTLSLLELESLIVKMKARMGESHE